MIELIRRIRDDLLAAEDSVCLDRARLVTEAYRRHESDPPPLRRARAFAHVLRHMKLDVASNPILAGNTSSRPRAWMLLPEYGFQADEQVLIENDGLDGLLDRGVPQDLRDFWAERSFGSACGIGHLAVDLHAVVHRGLEALIADARRRAEQGTAAERTYRQAMIVALRAVVDWAHRYADAAEAAAARSADPLVRDAHLRVAEACRNVPAQPARSLFEGLQAIALVHLALAIEGHGMSISIGLPDRVLASLVGENFDAEQATNWIAALLLKVASNSVFGRGSKTQAITVGGADRRGHDGCNELTLCFLAACDRVRVGDPHVFLRWHDRIDPRVKRRAIRMLSAGGSMPLLIHDEPTARGLVNAGVAEDDAWEYCVIGCNELGIPGRSAESATALAGTIQHLELLNETLLSGGDGDALADMGELLACLERTMRRRARAMRRRGEARRLQLAEQMPMPYTSALMRGCRERGGDFMVAMDYHLRGVYERGLTNAANALAAIQLLVFERRQLTMARLLEAMRGDFAEGDVRARLLAAPKWGNDDPACDRWAAALVELRERVLKEVDAEFGGRHVVCHVVRSLHYVDGRRIGASPDGRRARAPVADSIGAAVGTARAGPTAMLHSVLKLDAPTYYRGGYNLNLTLDRREAAPELLRGLVETFFAGGGQEIQVACLDADLLRAARRDPQRHRDLVVRISGFNARFIDLSQAEQDELIARADACAAPRDARVDSLRGRG